MAPNVLRRCPVAPAVSASTHQRALRSCSLPFASPLKPTRASSLLTGGVRVQPVRGEALLWYNMLPSDQQADSRGRDLRSLHGGCEVGGGRAVGKRATNFWFQSRHPAADPDGWVRENEPRFARGELDFAGSVTTG